MFEVLVLRSVKLPLYVLPVTNSSKRSPLLLLVNDVDPLKVLFPFVRSTPLPLFTMVVVEPKVLLPNPVLFIDPFFSR